MKAPIGALGFVLLLTCAVQTLCAQEQQDVRGGLAVGPTLIEIDADPGTVWNGRFTVAAEAFLEPRPFDIQLWDLGQDPGGAKVIVDRGKGARSAAGWIHLPSEVVLSGGERRTIPLEVRIPRDARGCYAAYVLVRLRAEKTATPMTAVILPSITVEVLVRVRSSGPLRVELDGLEWVAPTGRGNPTVLVHARNSGVWKAPLAGDVLLYPVSGGFPFRAEVPSTSSGRLPEIYPGQTLALRCPLTVRPPAGEYKALVRLDLGDGRGARRQFDLAVGRNGASGPVDAGSYELGTDLWIEREVIDLQLPPGASRAIPIRLRNLGSTPIALRASLVRARMESDGRPTFSQELLVTNRFEASVTPDSLWILPGREASLAARISWPRAASPDSGAVIGVRLAGRPEPAPPPGTAQQVYDTGVVVVISPTVLGAPELRVHGLELRRSNPDRNPGSAFLHIVNDGKATGFIQGKMTLRRGTGDQIAELTLGKDTWHPIVPGGQRTFRMPIPPLDDGEFVVRAEVTGRDAPARVLTAEARFRSVASLPITLR